MLFYALAAWLVFIFLGLWGWGWWDGDDNQVDNVDVAELKHLPHLFQMKKFLTNAWRGRQHQHHGLLFTIIAKKIMIIVFTFLLYIKVGDCGFTGDHGSARPRHLLLFEKTEKKSPAENRKRGRENEKQRSWTKLFISWRKMMDIFLMFLVFRKYIYLWEESNQKTAAKKSVN